MIGAIIGDIVGSRFEFDYRNCKSKDFEFFHEDCEFTDDSVLTVAVAKALQSYTGDYSVLQHKAELYMRSLALKYGDKGFGSMFCKWVCKEVEGPYNSYGNGAAMKISPVAYVAKDLMEVRTLSYAITSLTHNHPEGIKGAEAVAVATFLALNGKDKKFIKDCINRHYYRTDFTLDEIRPTYSMNESCQGSVPQAFEAFFESTSFEDAIRNAISIGGDSDTIGAITGSVAEAYYGVPKNMKKEAMKFLDGRMKIIVRELDVKYGKEAV